MRFLFNRLFVGAPRGNYTKPSRNKLLKKSEPGVAYRCNLPGSCVEIESTVLEDEKVYIRQIGMRAYLTNDHSWFGGAMSIERYSGFLTVRDKKLGVKLEIICN